MSVWFAPVMAALDALPAQPAEQALTAIMSATTVHRRTD